MNKVFIGMVVGVCILGMALLMLNERVSRKPEPVSQSSSVAQIDISDPAGKLPEDRNDDFLESSLKTNIPSELPTPKEIKDFEDEEARSALKMRGKAPVQPEVGAPIIETIPQATPPRVETPEIETPSQSEVIAAEKPAPVVQPKVEVPTVEDSQPKQAKIAEPKALAVPAAPQIASTPKAPAPVISKQETPKTVKTELKVNQAPKQSQPGKHEINNFVVFAREKGATVRFVGNNNMSYKNILLENPDRMVIDLDGNWTFPANMAIPKNELINAVRVGKNEDKTRIVIDLKVKPRISKLISTKNGAGLDVRLDK